MNWNIFEHNVRLQCMMPSKQNKRTNHSATVNFVFLWCTYWYTRIWHICVFAILRKVLLFLLLWHFHAILCYRSELLANNKINIKDICTIVQYPTVSDGMIISCKTIDKAFSVFLIQYKKGYAISIRKQSHDSVINF